MPLLSFRHVTLISFLISGALSAGMLLLPVAFFWLFGLDQDVAATVMLRRCGVLFAGLAVILWGARRARGASQVTFARGMFLMMGLMALLGLAELAFGRVGPGVLVAVITETLVAIGYFPYLRRRF